ncbi:hypothetical protein BKA67DRAFT_559411 [Truncatella angustata]|uniref:Uncharacterized protein n=1 Tax=Truncatella angustata TaxID=152316 RepID=A0A9P8ZYE5_9PEZI|nr:uncharacterized protein BKA67DRAFT_559411 [Truncatella angustata]KAH6655072.1 hypothetical protein BKA67DRAFT_559411 [Truncatella angustata]KAH8195418.1 hypothetical protein TruAng_010425 [Truncatella angustata]
MGRLGPLTSQALGRSPYDDVVEGTGQDDPHEPERQYDEKGRVINPETRQRTKNVIRAHNEVMEVIGVAEPENSSDSLELVMARDHQAYESGAGRNLLNIGRTLGVLGIWGVHGVRQRIMLYRPYSNVEFKRLWEYERERRSLNQLMLVGLPSFVVMHVIHWTRLSVDWVLDKPLLRVALGWCQFHLHLFLTMQRLGLIPSSKWLPGPKFFIPFTEKSPLPAPPPIDKLSAASIGGWISHLAVNMAPYAAFFLCGRIWNYVHINLWPHVHAQLPKPSKNEHYVLRPLPIEPRRTIEEDEWHTVPESPTLGDADHEIRHGRSPERDVPTLQALEGQGANTDNGIPFGAIRRQSTFSSRGGDQDYGTDEEDADMVNPTLISFDVDTSESNEQPAGVWSAELRPSFAGEGRQPPPDQPVYMVNPLTNLPAVLATDILTNFVTYILCAPFDTLATRATARAFARRRGLPTANMYQMSLLDGLCWRNFGNIFGIEIIRLLISGELWALTSIVSQWLHVSEDEWKEFHKEEQEQKERDEALARLEQAVDMLEGEVAAEHAAAEAHLQTPDQ